MCDPFHVFHVEYDPQHKHNCGKTVAMSVNTSKTKETITSAKEIVLWWHIFIIVPVNRVMKHYWTDEGNWTSSYL